MSNRASRATWLSLGLQLLRCLESDRASPAVAAKKVRPVRLDSPNFLNVQSGHLFDRRERRDVPVQSLRLQAVKRLVQTQMPERSRYIKNGSARSMHTEHRRA